MLAGTATASPRAVRRQTNGSTGNRPHPGETMNYSERLDELQQHVEATQAAVQAAAISW